MNARAFFAVTGVWLAACGGQTDDTTPVAVVAADAGTTMSVADAAPATVPGAIACDKASRPDNPDAYIKSLEGKPCEKDASSCDSNNGCGGCFLKCVNHVWTADGHDGSSTSPSDTVLCYTLGNGC